MMSVKIENHLASKLQSIALKLIAKNQYSNYLAINFYANEKGHFNGLFIHKYDLQFMTKSIRANRYLSTQNLGSVYPISTTEHKIKSIADYKMHP